MRQLILILLILQSAPVLGQANKKIEKAVETFNSGEIEKGISMMQKIKNKYPSDENWNILIDMYYHRFEYAKENATDAVVSAIGESLGAKMEHESYTSPKICFEDLISKCREASLYSQSTRASQLLRNYFIDYEPDTAISKKSKEEFKTAELYFSKKDYTNSKIYYQKALTLEPNFYKATIYLGDSYWYLGNMDSAIHYFHKGIKMNPDLLEPRKYLIDALGYSRKNEEAKNECINAIYAYPDQSIFLKFEELLKREGKKFNKHWTKRGSEINSLKWNENKIKDPLWSEYQNAENKIKAYCDSNGIIVKANTITEEKYLEVYSWQQMLNSSKKLPDDLMFAKKMADEGFLDCYVFISVFHYDLYDQYVDFVKNNKAKIKKYIETYLID